ncbi:MAG: enoyl-CoA hydratase/isomerase family protein [Cyanobacteria bacterium REEB65]|nr:enoyl-CoA hydratase/isomerase family protein [Cyanobacteria bacterium REEB65]
MTTQSTTSLEVEVSDHICTITLNRPDCANALNFAAVLALRETLADLRQDPAIRVLVLTGAGPKAFCAGADLKERSGLTPDEVRQFVFNIRELMTDVATFPRPVLAAINGVALGGGTELALGCDVRIAAENALLGLTETSLAILPGAGGTQRLPRLIGIGRAKELIFTARKISAAEALEIGMVERLVAEGHALPAALDMARAIAANGPKAIEMAKWAINRGIEVDLATGLEIESRAYEAIIPTQDRLEGLAAFREKRRPVYLGS